MTCLTITSVYEYLPKSSDFLNINSLAVKIDWLPFCTIIFYKVAK